MISGLGKNQFIRQKNIELNPNAETSIQLPLKEGNNSPDESKRDEIKNIDKCNKNISENNIEQNNYEQTIKNYNNLVDKLDFNGISLDHNNNKNNEEENDDARKNNLFTFPSNTNLNQKIRVETSPSSSSASSSPCNLTSSTSPHLQIETNNNLSPNRCSLNPQSNNIKIGQSTSSSSFTSLSNLTGSNSDLNAASLTEILKKNSSNGNKIQISHNLKQKLTKAATGPSSSRQQQPQSSNKPRRLGNIMGFSVGSFFSKSISANEENFSPENDSSRENSTGEQQQFDKQSMSTSKSRDNSRQRKFGKSILALSVFSGYNSKLKKNESESSSSSVTSSKNTLIDLETIPPVNIITSDSNTALPGSVSPPRNMRNISLSLTKNSANSKSTETTSAASNKKKIGSFDVDLEKLARELILPSIDAPLTSFNNNGNENIVASSASLSTKPPLLTSKTIDTNNLRVSNKAMMQRSLTNNK